MKFTAPDGKEFSDKKAYRNYMMEQFYSFKNRHDEDNLVKSPGDIDGQVFDIADCSNSTLVVMDLTDQVQIDNLINCKVFIGACSSSLYIRNCKDCIFFTCSRQLRLRDCENSFFYSYCQSEIHIELSSNVQFGPFLGGYAQQKDHFVAAGFDPAANLWYDIYDHNDPAKSQANWSLVESSSYAAPWYPMGECEPCCVMVAPIAKAPSQGTGGDSGQVGEAFGLEQMIADSNKAQQPAYRNPDSSKKIPIESALLVVTASSREINVPLWFNESGNEGKMKAKEFNSKLTSLSSTLSVNQDVDTKRELEVAVSKQSLREIEAACGVGVDELGNAIIDLTHFIRTSHQIVDEFISKMDEAEESIAQHTLEGDVTIADSNAAIAPQDSTTVGEEGDLEPETEHFDYIAEYTGRAEAYRNTTADPAGSVASGSAGGAGGAGGGAGGTGGIAAIPLEHKSIEAYSLEEYIDDLKARGAAGAFPAGNRPQSAPAGRRGRIQGEVVSETFSPSPTPGQQGRYGAVHSSHIDDDDDHDEDEEGEEEEEDGVAIAETIKLPSSPYDEQVSFASRDEDDEEVDSAYLDSRRNSSSSGAAVAAVAGNQAGNSSSGRDSARATASDHHWEEENRRFLMASTVAEIPPVRPHSPSSQQRAATAAVAAGGANRPRPAKTTGTTIATRTGMRGVVSASAAAGVAAGATAEMKPRPSSAPRMGRSARPTVGAATTASTALGMRRERMGGAGGVSSSAMSGITSRSTDYVRSHSADGRARARHSYGGGGGGLPSGRGVGGGAMGPTTTKNRNARASHSSSNAMMAVRSSTEQLEAMKDLVEDLVRKTVKKADLYHRIQVYLGFIDSYTMVPPRGAIVTSRARTWLTHRDIQTAFISARLCLTNPQVELIRSLVHGFAQQQNFMLIDPEVGVGNSSSSSGAGSGKKAVLGPGKALSAAWLKKYLVHLRLHKKTKSAASSTSVPATSVGGGGTSSAGEVPAPAKVSDPKGSPKKDERGAGAGAGAAGSPLQWKDWLGRKLQGEVKRDSVKPREFEKALNGKNHPLSKEDIELMLKTYNVLPADIAAQEVECRIESWLLDMDGRRDFQHELNVKIRHWIWNKKSQEKIKMPTNEKGYWMIWQKLPDEEKKAVKAEICSTIIEEKRQELLAQERTDLMITKELYWKFDEERKLKEWKWNAWLPEHIAKFKSDLENFRKSEQARQVRGTSQQTQRKTVAGLNEVQEKLRKAQNDLRMDSYHQIELQKAINALRRTAMIKGVAKGTVITKEDFDRHIKSILAPYVVFDQSAATGTGVAGGEAVKRGLDSMFHRELKTAVDKVVELEKERTAESRKGYDAWLHEKRLADVERSKKKREEEEQKKKEQIAKDKRNKKEYRKWLNLRKKDMYRSKVDNKPHTVPAVKTIAHKNRWNNDKELHEYYEEMGKKY